jgi:hypothetical protein
MKRTETWIVVAVVTTLLALVCCVCLAAIAGIGYFFMGDVSTQVFGPFTDPTVTPVVIRPAQEATPQVEPSPAGTLVPSPTPAPGRTPLSTAVSTPQATPVPGEETADTLQVLGQVTIPPRDLFDLAERLEGKTGIEPTLSDPPPVYQLGDRETFWASDGDTNENFEVVAVLRYITDHGYFWIEQGVSFDQDELRQLAETFEREIYPTNREFFGSEWTPGVDNDPHLYILYARGLGSGVAGYFSSLDSFPPELIDFSNGHEMFLFNAGTVGLAEEFTYGVLAHEFQHMIHWYRDRDESRWLNEGLSDLAMLLNGYDIGGHDYMFALNPDLQLNDWPTEEGQSSPNYGAAFLFTTYFLERFGDEATQALVGNEANGLESVDRVLVELGVTDPLTGAPLTADEFFLDWALANYLNDDRAGDGRYGYRSYASAPDFDATETIDNCPTDTQVRDVRQYGVDYIRLDCRGDYTLTFEGSIQVPVIPANPYSGEYAFWSNKGDEAVISLSQTFDFTGHSGPLTLSYRAWFDLEEDFDYVYLTASTDGENWEMLRPPAATTADPTGANYGWGYNGTSGGGREAEWILEEVDLSQFAGETVELRFEYVTDAGVHGEGFLLDDVAITEIGYATDFEMDDGGWRPAGFARIQNALPQTFRLALITIGQETEVQYIPVDPDVSAQIPLELSGDVREAVLVVTGTTRYTRQPAAYQFTIHP